jgi:FkbM family methyltransferase
MNNLIQLRLAKLLFSLSHPQCWPALARGVAPSVEHRAVLRDLDCDLLLDVGANRGQFSLMTRILHHACPVHAYEPLPSEAAIFQAVVGRQPGVTLHVLALGDQPGEAELHVSRQRDSSSLLPIGALQTGMFPRTEEVGTCRVLVVTLDSLPGHWAGASRALLKLDVQGFELGVLRGAREALSHCAYVYVECSEIPLYTGQALYPEVAAFLSATGFQPSKRVNEQWSDGRLVQADHLFTRS